MINARTAKRIRDRGLVPVIDPPGAYSSARLEELCHRVKALFGELNTIDIEIGELAELEPPPDKTNWKP
jgi:hypothetical protein